MKVNSAKHIKNRRHIAGNTDIALCCGNVRESSAKTDSLNEQFKARSLVPPIHLHLVAHMTSPLWYFKT